MSITRKAFNKGKFSSKAEANNRKSHPIYVFLIKHSSQAFTSKEIAKAVKLTESGVRSMLRDLMKLKYVEHKSPYFIAVLNSKNKKK